MIVGGMNGLTSGSSIKPSVLKKFRKSAMAYSQMGNRKKSIICRLSRAFPSFPARGAIA